MRIRKSVWMPLLWLVVLVLVMHSCAQPAVPESTATPPPPTDMPTEEPAPTDEPTATQEPTATTEPTVTPEAETPTVPPTEEAEPTPAPIEAEGQILLDERCTGCHSLSRVTRAQKSREGWETTVDRMIGLGARLTDDERAVIIDYLVVTYGD